MNSLIVDTEDASVSFNVSESVNTESTHVTPRPRDSSLKFDFSRISLKDEGLYEVAEEMMSVLHFTINKEFNIRAESSEEELFHLPDDIQNCTLLEQMNFVKDLVFKVCGSYLKLLTPTEETAIENSPKRLSKRRMTKSKSVVLSQEDCQILCDLLSSPQSKPGSVAPADYASLQDRYAELGQKLLESQAQLRKKEDDVEHVIETNMGLRTSCKVMKQQIKSLERQLVDNMEETYSLEEKYQKAMSELAVYRAYNILETPKETDNTSNDLTTTPSFRQPQERFSFSKYL